ncbi:MAG: hypothetical protein JSS81_07525 [Acidobacteria bacterium]|nr:hypothetical protein [Acidobacteriota bacterium]
MKNSAKPPSKTHSTKPSEIFKEELRKALLAPKVAPIRERYKKIAKARRKRNPALIDDYPANLE